MKKRELGQKGQTATAWNRGWTRTSTDLREGRHLLPQSVVYPLASATRRFPARPKSAKSANLQGLAFLAFLALLALLNPPKAVFCHSGLPFDSSFGFRHSSFKKNAAVPENRRAKSSIPRRFRVGLDIRFYFLPFFAGFFFSASFAAIWAAARRAIGTRNGEQET